MKCLFCYLVKPDVPAMEKGGPVQAKGKTYTVVLLPGSLFRH